MVLNAPKGRVMIDPHSRAGRDLKAAEEFFTLAKTAASPFMRAYYWRVAERYLSSESKLRSLQGQGNIRANLAPPQFDRSAS
jgi:hypothetical protein